VPALQASAFGVMGIDQAERIIEFQEKPQHPLTVPGDETTALVSMGIYVFSKEVLCKVLADDNLELDSDHDFGKNIIPRMIQRDRVYGYAFGGAKGRVSADYYWRDVGTIDAFYEANMDLLKPLPPLDLYQENWGIRTYHGQNPPARMVPGPSGAEGLLVDSILGSGALLMGAIVKRSILASRVRVGEGAVVEDSVLFDHVTVGEGAVLRRCIIDKYVDIPPGTTLGVDRQRDQELFTVSEQGIIVVPRGYRFNAA
ncbi:MAG: sugar phosphate nucleotidyltransferase, partial [Methylococcaceae bacterium]